MLNPVAVVSGMLGLWGGWTKNRPQVSLIAESLFGAGQRYLYLVVHNPAKAQIRVTSITVEPGFFEVWRDDSVEAAGDAWCGIAASAFIDPESEKRFPVVLSKILSEENRELLCKVTLRWRSMRQEHIPSIPVIYKTKVMTLEAQRDNKA